MAGMAGRRGFAHLTKLMTDPGIKKPAEELLREFGISNLQRKVDHCATLLFMIICMKTKNFNGSSDLVPGVHTNPSPLEAAPRKNGPVHKSFSMIRTETVQGTSLVTSIPLCNFPPAFPTAKRRNFRQIGHINRIPDLPALIESPTPADTAYVFALEAPRSCIYSLS
ncbi:hypothetical protein B0H13DRAFT_1903746 [Mycena leptocephala]|nr:hypothetical protein B0H13DRAFT_1903746 [Mycena leptocephala]